MKIWRRQDDKNRLDNLIFETSFQPFGVSAYNPNERVSDFVGRREELSILKAQTDIVWRHKISRAIRIEGPGGVGKSTLFNFLKESIEAERVDTHGTVKYLSKNTDIFSTYFQVPDRIQEFGDIWKPMLEGLTPGFSEETQADIGLSEYVALHLIFRMFKEDPQTVSLIIWPDNQPTNSLKFIEFKDIIDPVLDGGRKTVELIQDYFNRNKRIIREYLRTEVNNVGYEIKRTDNRRISELFRVLDEDDPEDYLEKIRDADKSIFSSNDELIRYFNDLMRFYACCTSKQPLLLLGIDEVAKTDEEVGTSYYRTLGNLFVRLRNSLNYVLFVFISTTEDWAKYDQVISFKSDLHSQIQDFMHRIVLKQLDVSEMTMVFKNRMERFWTNYPTEKPTKNRYYPFSSDCFEYVYRYHMRDLRKSINFLDELWRYSRFNRVIPTLADMYSTMRVVRSTNRKEFDPDDFKKFEWDIFERSFNDPSRFKTNSARSSFIEKGIESAWKCLQEEQGSPITKVENNPIIITSSGKRKPDIYVELHGNLGAEYRRFIEFQVKAYQKGSNIDLKHVESSLELFKEGYTDLLYFIITGKGLNTKAEYQVKILENKYPTRIRRPPLKPNQERFLYFLALFEEITGEYLGMNPERDIPIANKIISNILGQQVEKFLVEVKNLSYRRSEITSDSVDENESIETVITSQPYVQEPIPLEKQPQSETPLTPFVSVERKLEKPIEIPPVHEIAQWLKDYPWIKAFRYEACALCSYMKTREKGRYKHKFTSSTVLKNVIRKDVSTSLTKFKDLIKHLSINQCIEKEKASYKWTKLGFELYQAVKACNFQC